MTDDTKRALEIIKPIADELGITVKADDKILYIQEIGIGISCNSTWATLWEFIGYLITVYDSKFRRININNMQKHQIKRFWLSHDVLKKISVEPKAEGSDT